jgi:hypothetical protein
LFLRLPPVLHVVSGTPAIGATSFCGHRRRFSLCSCRCRSSFACFFSRLSPAITCSWHSRDRSLIRHFVRSVRSKPIGCYSRYHVPCKIFNSMSRPSITVGTPAMGFTSPTLSVCLYHLRCGNRAYHSRCGSYYFVLPLSLWLFLVLVILR